MALTKEDLQAIGELTRAVVKDELEPLNTRLDGIDERLDTMQADINAMKDDVDQIKEDTAITRAAVNELGEWTEVASDVLKIRYPLSKAE